jgi:HD-GYP domain-containing protein (c-di-GMP phosphodiesterase class II)
MTMRMEAGVEEPGRREQTLDAGAETIVALYRFARVSVMHEPAHQAFLRQLEQTHQALVDYCGRAGRFFSAFFTPAGTFIGGELLRGARATQEAANEFGAMLEARGVSELAITKDVAPEDLLDLSRLVAAGTQFASARVRVRRVDDIARTRGLAVEHLPIDKRIARTYAEAVVTMRRLFDELLAGRYVLPPRVKRLAHAFVDLAASQNPFFVGITEADHPQPDEAVRAVNAAVLSAAMARELGADREKSVEIVLAALLYDAALARIRARAVEQTGRTGETPEADTELPAGTAAAIGTFVGLHEDGMPRVVVAFEAQWGRFAGALGSVYHGARAATLQSRIVAAAHDWTRLRLAEGEKKPRSLDDAVSALLEDRQEASELAVARLLVAILRFYPLGSVVELDTGEIAEVLSSVNIGWGAPRVRITIDKSGKTLPRPLEVDLGDAKAKPHRSIVRVRSVEGWRRLERTTTPHELPRPKLPQVELSDAPRASLPSISPGLIENVTMSESENFMQALRAELADQLNEQAPREKSTPGIEELPKFMPSRAPDSPAVSSKPRSGPIATAKGTLGTTPLVHVLIHVLDHGISGSIELTEPNGTIYIIFVRRGAPVKVKSGKLLAPLGELLAQANLLSAEKIPDLVGAAEAAGILFGEHLITQGLITRGQLWSTLELQIPLKLERLTNLPPETTYSLYRDVNLLERYGGADAVAADPVHAIHCMVRRWHDRARIRGALARIAKHPLIIHPEAKIGGLKPTADEEALLEAMRTQRATLNVLSHMHLTDVESLSSLVYTLAITRQLDLPGKKKAGPMGMRSASLPAPPRPRSIPPASGPTSTAPSAAAASSSRKGEAQATSPSHKSGDAQSAAPKIAEAIANALSAPPSGGTGQEIALPPPAPTPDAPALMTAGGVPRSSGTGMPPVSSSRERMVDAVSSRRGAFPPPSSRTAGSAGMPPLGAPADALDAAERALDAMTSFREGEAALLKGDAALAERKVLEAYELDPEPVDYRAVLGWIRAQGTPVDGLAPIIGLMTDLLVEHPDHPRVLLYRARLLRRQGRVREAIADYETHLKFSPKSKEALAELKALKG